MESPPAGWQARCLHLLLNSLAFGICYPLANLLAKRQDIRRHLALPFEQGMPFLPWMIVPYLCSGLLFTVCFFAVRSRDELAVLSRRLLLATVAATLIFALYPLHFHFERPPIESPLWAGLFAMLSLVDRPYNQLPSLHVAYCLIFWPALQPAGLAGRCALALGLTLVALSTLFTYQHHLVDIAGGAVLGLAALWLLARGRADQPVAFYYCMAAGIVFLAGVLALRSLPAAWLAASLLLVALAYARHDRYFLHKRSGAYPVWIWLLYGPYLAGYWLTWQLVRLRESARPPFLQPSGQLAVGRRLSAAEAARLPSDCVVFDLANELAETPALRGHDCRYFPLLDLLPPDAAVIEQITVAIETELARGRPVYLHCAMGYSRSVLIANALSKKIQVDP